MGLTLNTNSLTIPVVEQAAAVAVDIGAYEFISQIVSTDASTIEFSNVFTTTYDIYKITGTNVGGSVSNISLRAQVEKASGVYAAYDYYNRLNPNSTSTFTYGAGDYWTTAQNNTGSDAQRFNFTVDIFNPRSSNAKHALFWGCGYSGFSNIPVNWIMAALQNTSTDEQTGIKLYASSGTLTGTFRLYGLSKT